MTSAGEAISLGEMMREFRGHRGIVQKKKFTTMSHRCVAANCRNVVDLSKCILVHNIPFFGD